MAIHVPLTSVKKRHIERKPDINGVFRTWKRLALVHDIQKESSTANIPWSELVPFDLVRLVRTEGGCAAHVARRVDIVKGLMS